MAYDSRRQFYFYCDTGACFQPTKTYLLFLLFSLKHAQNPLLVFSSLPASQIKYYYYSSWLFCSVLIPIARVIYLMHSLIDCCESSAPHVGTATSPFRFRFRRRCVWSCSHLWQDWDGHPAAAWASNVAHSG